MGPGGCSTEAHYLHNAYKFGNLTAQTIQQLYGITKGFVDCNTSSIASMNSLVGFFY
jgi:hypothetical protein